MYQVIEMYGENEPWYFFDNWQVDIECSRAFDNFNAAKEFYTTKVDVLSKKYENSKAKQFGLFAFWNESETEYCDSCGDDVQLYKGLLLLKEGEPLKEELETL